MATEKAADAGAPARLAQRYGGIVCLVFSAAAAFGIGKMFEVPSGLPLGNVPKHFACQSAVTDAEVVGLFATRSQWLGMVVLEAVTAAFAVVASAAILKRTIGKRLLALDALACLSLVGGVAAMLVDACNVWSMREYDPTTPHGTAFLSQLLSTLPVVEGCNGVRRAVAWARLLGEPAGIFLGVTMTSLVTFFEVPSPEELSRRSRLLNQLLYLSSLLFVAGILMSRANFTWVLAQWDVPNDELRKGLRAVITAGVLQSGIGYSALLVVFYAPVRWFLSREVGRVAPGSPDGDAKVRAQWLEKYGLSLDFQADVKQVLAILAPVISAPIFDAIAK